MNGYIVNYSGAMLSNLQIWYVPAGFAMKKNLNKYLVLSLHTYEQFTSNFPVRVLVIILYLIERHAHKSILPVQCAQYKVT